MKTFLSLVIVLGLVPIAKAQQEGAAEKAGKSLDSAAESIREGFENAIDSVKSSVENKELQSRTYLRLHWDRALNKSNLDVDIKDNGAIVLRGSVADAAAKRRAIELAKSTVGVTSVVDELVVGKEKPVKTTRRQPETPDRTVPPIKNTEIEPKDNP